MQNDVTMVKAGTYLYNHEEDLGIFKSDGEWCVYEYTNIHHNFGGPKQWLKSSASFKTLKKAIQHLNTYYK